MRTDLPQSYLDAASSERHHLRLVIEIEFDPSNRYFFTSHRDIKNIPGTVVYNSLKNTSATTQKLNPIAAQATIGEINFELIDKNRFVTDILRIQAQSGRGINGRTVRLYKARKVTSGDVDFLTEFGVFQTQQITKEFRTDGGRYKVQCQDIQRQQRPDIYVPAKTRLAANFMKGAGTLTVYQTSQFEYCPHGPSFSDAPGTLVAPRKVIYVTVKSDAGVEICRAESKTSTTFGITARGLFGTRELDHVIDGTPGSDNGPEVIEFVYLELPAPKFYYAVNTGRLLGQGGADPTLYTLPKGWHLGIAESMLVAADFNNADGNITDLYDPSNDTGHILRLDGGEKTEGKAWLETQVLLPSGCYAPINSKGQLGLRRMVRILSDAATISTIDERVITKIDDISYNLSEIFNHYRLNWSWLNLTDKPQYWRFDEVTDQLSIDKWKVKQTKELSFQTLHASRHTKNVTRSCINWLRDMYAGPPINAKLDLMPSCDVFEVGDVHRLRTAHIPDHLGAASLDRAVMIIGATVNQVTGKVSAEVFGSTFPATPLADLESAVTYELPDAWYNSQGTALSSLPGCVISGGIMTSAPTAGINGTSDITASGSIFYHLGDLTIPAGLLPKITGNVWLRIRGHFQVEGTVDGVGGGMPAGAQGYIGPTESGGAMRIDWRPTIEVDSFEGGKVVGRVPALPAFGIDNNAGTLTGMPRDMRGTGSPAAGPIYDDASANGGAGAKGGAALMITSRGGGFGAAGRINLSGEAGKPGGIVNFQNNPKWQFQASSSGGGAPGCLLWLLDGATSVIPILPGRFIADYGALSYSPGFVPCLRAKDFHPVGMNIRSWERNLLFQYHNMYPGKGGEQIGISAARIQFVPPSRTPYLDYVPPQLAGAIEAAEDANAAAFAAQADADAALLELGDIGADGKLHKNEKIKVIREYGELTQEQAGIDAQAVNFGITTEKTNYDNALIALTSYLGGLSPAWNNTGSTTTISRTIWDANWKDVYNKRQILLNKIADEAAKRALWGGVTGTGRPADNAQVNAPGFGCKINFDSFTNANNGELYIHGFDSAGAAADVDGWINYGGTKLSVPKGVLATNAAAQRGYIVWDRASRFSTANGGSPRYALAWHLDGAWSYDNNATVSAFTPDDSHLVIGSMRTNASADGAIPRASVWQDAQLCDVVAEIGSTRGAPAGTLVAGIDAANVRYTDYMWRGSDDLTPVRTIINRINNGGRPSNQRFLRAFHLAGTQAARGGTAPSAADVGSTATITVNAWSAVTDLGTINYNSGSITGLSFSTKYYVYAIDPDLNGGAVTYAASTDYTAPSANADRVYVGTITTPADGGGGTGGGGGGGDWCVAVTAWLPDVAGGKPWRAAFAHKDRPLWVLNDTDDGVISWPIRSVDLAQSDCVTLETETGIRLTLSVSTPITLKGGGTVRAPDCLHLDVPVLDEGAFRWERVTRITPAGYQMVARIHVDQLTYAAGDQQHRYILTHNPQKP